MEWKINPLRPQGFTTFIRKDELSFAAGDLLIKMYVI